MEQFDKHDHCKNLNPYNITNALKYTWDRVI